MMAAGERERYCAALGARHLRGCSHGGAAISGPGAGKWQAEGLYRRLPALPACLGLGLGLWAWAWALGLGTHTPCSIEHTSAQAKTCTCRIMYVPAGHLSVLCELGRLARSGLVLAHVELIAGSGHRVEAHHLDRQRRRRGLHVACGLCQRLDLRCKAWSVSKEVRNMA